MADPWISPRPQGYTDLRMPDTGIEVDLTRQPPRSSWRLVRSGQAAEPPQVNARMAQFTLRHHPMPLPSPNKGLISSAAPGPGKVLVPAAEKKPR